MNDKTVTLNTQGFKEVLMETIDKGQPVRLRVSGQSMWPLFRHGKTVVTLAPLPDRPLKKHDIVLFVQPNGMFVLHRIVTPYQERIQTRGDALKRFDVSVSKQTVKAIVTHYQNHGKMKAVDCLAQKIYIRTWNFLLPFRRYILRFTRWMRRR